MDKMNQLIGYLSNQMGKPDCPIIMVDDVTDFGIDAVWQRWVEIRFNDGTTLELVEKPK